MFMSYLQVFKEIIWQPWKIIVDSIILVSGLYDLFFAQYAAETIRPYAPRIADLLKNLGWPWYIWLITFLVTTIIIAFDGAYKYLNRLVEPPQLSKLGELRAVGIEHRNKGTTLLSESTMKKWREEQISWEHEVLSVLKDLSTEDYESFRYLDLFTKQRPFPSAVNAEHRLYLQVYDEKLQRLRDIINKHGEGKRRVPDVRK
jgi:hypothetical protein